MRSRKRVLLDTSFLLPSLGISTGDRVLKGLKRLASWEWDIYYSRHSLVEILWVLKRLRSKGIEIDEETVRKGLKAVFWGYKEYREGEMAFLHALKMVDMGFRDTFDCILYSSALEGGLLFLTVDRELEKFILNSGIENVVLRPEDL